MTRQLLLLLLLHVSLWFAQGASGTPLSSISLSATTPRPRPGPDIEFDVPGTRTRLHIAPPGVVLPAPWVMEFFLADIANDVRVTIAQKGQYWPMARDHISQVTYSRWLNHDWVRFEAGWYPPKGERFYTYGRVLETILGMSDIIDSREYRVSEQIIKVIDIPTGDVLGLTSVSYRGPGNDIPPSLISSLLSNCTIGCATATLEGNWTTSRLPSSPSEGNLQTS